jgi:uncharacterized protein (TIGR02118 family)
MVTFNISLQRRRSDLGIEEYRQHWLHPHGPMTSRLPGLRFYVQNHVLFDAGTNALAEQLGIDGFAELAYDSVAARAAAYDSPVAQETNRDTPLFLGGVSRLVTESDGWQPEDDQLVKAILVAPRLAAPNATVVPTLETVRRLCAPARRLAEHRILEQAVPTKGTVPFIGLEIDLLVEAWFESEADLEACACDTALADHNLALFHIRAYRFV